MNEELPEEFETLAIDVNQWRREIQLFSESTEQALHAIVAELSNRCSHGFTTSSTASFSPEVNASAPSHPTAEPFQASSSSIRASEDNRLSDMKARLAKRIAKSN